MPKRSANKRGTRIDVTGAASIAVVLSAMLTLAVPHASADRSEGNPTQNAGSTSVGKKFKGKLPIMELTEDEAIMHSLNRLGYGPHPGDVERIRKIGLEKWVDQQLHPESIDDAALEERLDRYPTLDMSSAKLLEKFPRPEATAKKEGITKEEAHERTREKGRDAMAQLKSTGNDNLDKARQQLAKMQGPNRITAELSMAKLDRAVYSQRQLEAVMEDFWFNHFNVFANKEADRWLVTPYVRDTIRPNTMGRFQDLLIATAKSPAMLFYLDNWQSADAAAIRARQEAAARRGRYQGAFESGSMPTPGTFPGPVSGPPNGNAAPAKKQERGLNENYGREVMELHTVGVDAGYTQQDVIAMAECLTGWTVHEPRKDPQFVFDERIHTEAKQTVMGRTFSYGGMKDGEEALKMLANSPKTAKFVSTKLARHFVSDNPPPELVDRMTRTFESSGGDIRAVLKTMIYSPEFWSKDAYRAKVKTPFELVASTVRALDAEVPVSLPLVNWVARMGEPLFLCQPPAGYSDKAETWVNTGALLNRMNFALAFAADRMPGAKVDLRAKFGPDAEADPSAALARALALFLDSQVAPQTRKTLEARLGDPQVLRAQLDDEVKQVNEGLIAGLVLGSPEFQRR
jgi:uncharacterized protein (DUF1800 family)